MSSQSYGVGVGLDKYYIDNSDIEPSCKGDGCEFDSELRGQWTGRGMSYVNSLSGDKAKHGIEFRYGKRFESSMESEKRNILTLGSPAHLSMYGSRGKLQKYLTRVE